MDIETFTVTKQEWQLCFIIIILYLCQIGYDLYFIKNTWDYYSSDYEEYCLLVLTWCLGLQILIKINKFLPCYMVTTQHSILTNHPNWPSLVPHALINMTYHMQMWSYYLATLCMCLWWQAL